MILGAVPEWVIGLDAGASFVIGFVAGAVWLLVKVTLQDRRGPGRPPGLVETFEDLEARGRGDGPA